MKSTIKKDYFKKHYKILYVESLLSFLKCLNDNSYMILDKSKSFSKGIHWLSASQETGMQQVNTQHRCLKIIPGHLSSV